ncbi:SAM-dependent methyltransferase [Jeongeupia naejangsanensis]|uniref:Class I SAM-dependent methyltransferase n=1 Tax=Jeongeupia naejangsanensis TaxID=613195 RepID=A0ABS2BNQ8_9NEIS|nr:cyclopropane-fatty-acyl-phospholipid synthase family protein [Jeongeupia naejangsanensis]MBM3117262.1 class I SAM-dependent methyltransferase [Jeongeupia naejangsanensis]
MSAILPRSAIPLPASRPPATARALLAMLPRLQRGQLLLTLPDGQQLRFGQPDGGPHAELQLHDWRACARILRSGDIGFAEALRDGWLASADLTALLRLVLQNEAVLTRTLFGGRLAGLVHRLRHWLHRNSRRGSARNIHAHYDLGNDFYALWLDDSQTYSSAWFDGDLRQDLGHAQAAKYQRIIDVLKLRRGMRILEIGCGWGGFLEHAAQRGLTVHGVTLSREQLALAQTRLAGLPSASVELCDYRDLRGRYDAIVSIEMFEAVGEAYWDGYMATLQRLLRPGGAALVQSITIDEARFARYRAGSDFIQQFVFPGGMLPSPQRFVAAAARRGLRCEDQLHFGADYAETLRRWHRAFEHRLHEVRAQGFDEAFIRIWRLYLAYCEAGFDEGRIGVAQFALRRD